MSSPITLPCPDDKNNNYRSHSVNARNFFYAKYAPQSHKLTSILNQAKTDSIIVNHPHSIKTIHVQILESAYKNKMRIKAVYGSPLTETSYDSWRDSPTKEQTHEVCLRGTVPEINQKMMTFQLDQIHGTEVTCSMSSHHLKIILDAFNGYIDGTKILIQGIGTYTNQGYLKKIKVIEHIHLLSPLDVLARLDEFRNIRDGWLEGSGTAPSHTGLDWLATAFKKFCPDSIPLPHTYPTPDGGVRMEWSHNDNAVIFEIDLLNHKGKYFSFNLFSDNELEYDLDLNSPDHWQQLAIEIQNRIMKDS